MKIVCIHFKGGVGKSTTAVHVVGVLAGAGRKTLLVDGDRQVSSYVFFNQGQPPSSFDELVISPEISLFPLHTQMPSSGAEFSKRLRAISKLKFQNLVFDTTPDPATTSQILAEIRPDLVLIPVKLDDAGSHAQLKHLLSTIEKMTAIGVSPRVKILPLGGDGSNILPYVDVSELNYKITPTIPLLPTEFGNAVYRDFCYVWQYPGCESIHQIYYDIVMG